MVSYELRQPFTMSTSALVWSAKLFSDTTARGTPDGRGIIATGTLQGRSIRWEGPLNGYRVDGTVRCEGSLCGSVRRAGTGTSDVHIPPSAVSFQPFALSPDGKTFTMAYVVVSRADSPKQTTLISLAGREVRRFVPWCERRMSCRPPQRSRWRIPSLPATVERSLGGEGDVAWARGAAGFFGRDRGPRRPRGDLVPRAVARRRGRGPPPRAGRPPRQGRRLRPQYFGRARRRRRPCPRSSRPPRQHPRPRVAQQMATRRSRPSTTIGGLPHADEVVDAAGRALHRLAPSPATTTPRSYTSLPAMTKPRSARHRRASVRAWTSSSVAATPAYVQEGIVLCSGSTSRRGAQSSSRTSAKRASSIVQFEARLLKLMRTYEGSSRAFPSSSLVLAVGSSGRARRRHRPRSDPRRADRHDGAQSAQTQSVAPATTVTITSDDIRRYGIHTIDEAINFLAAGMATSRPR